uniref:Uncharacterized protein n=1 Tax=Plectus sambesii TaxID=2011161 RepID=A0A914VG10_9BILA
MSGKRPNAARKTISAPSPATASKSACKKSKVAPVTTPSNHQSDIDQTNGLGSGAPTSSCSSDIVATPPQTFVKIERETPQDKQDCLQFSEFSVVSSSRSSPHVSTSVSSKTKSVDYSDESGDEDDLFGEEIVERERAAALVKLTIIRPADYVAVSLSTLAPPPPPQPTHSTTAKFINGTNVIPLRSIDQQPDPISNPLKTQISLNEINDQLTKMNAVMVAISERCGRLESGQNEIKAALTDVLRRLPPPPKESVMVIEEGPPDYLLLPKEVVDRFQRSTDSVTAFGRRLARALYKKPEEYQNCRNRSPTRLDFIRRIVHSRFPPKGAETELNNWRTVIKQLDADSRHIRAYLKQNRQFTYLEEERMFVVRPLEGDNNEPLLFTGGSGHNGIITVSHQPSMKAASTIAHNGITARSTSALPPVAILDDVMSARETDQRYAFADNVALQ